jgi:uncharacterized protein (TIGR02217 family)
MSQFLYPTLQGQSIEVVKTALWKNVVQPTTSGKEVRIKLWSYPKYKIELKYNFLTNINFNYTGTNSGDLETLIEFFNKVGGNYSDFLYLDPVDNTVTNQIIGISDGSTRDFQLVRSVNTWIEPIFGVKTITNIKIDGVANTNYTVNDYGLITFDSAPASGSITWSGQYYFRVRFDMSELEASQFLTNLYECGSVSLITVKI